MRIEVDHCGHCPFFRCEATTDTSLPDYCALDESIVFDHPDDSTVLPTRCPLRWEDYILSPNTSRET